MARRQCSAADTLPSGFRIVPGWCIDGSQRHRRNRHRRSWPAVSVVISTLATLTDLPT